MTTRMSFGPAISSMSLGRAWVHGLEHKLDMACRYGYKGLELFWEDLEYYARELYGDNDLKSRSKAARKLRKLCDDRDIAVISMQPFYHYEGLRDRKLHTERIEKLHEWFAVAKVLGTDLILIPSNFLPAEELSGDFDEMVADLRLVAHLGLAQNPPIRFCYENLAWGTYVSTWQACWDLVHRVDMPNFGICLDAFNIAALVYADPVSSGGCAPDCDSALSQTLAELVNTVDPAKFFLYQMVDAERLKEPLVEGHAFYDPAQPARMSWSRNCRLFYGEAGGYLPIKQISQAVLHQLGYQGHWISAELFNRCMADPDPGVPEDLARRGRDSFRIFQQDLNLTLPRNDVVEDTKDRAGRLGTRSTRITTATRTRAGLLMPTEVLAKLWSTVTAFKAQAVGVLFY